MSYRYLVVRKESDARLHAILGDHFIEKVKPNGELISKELEELIDIESDRYEMKEMDLNGLKQALLGFLGPKAKVE